MHAIRGIPLISRPSRSSSPAPTSSHVNATGTVTSPSAASIPLPPDGKPRSRSLSRQVADKLAPPMTITPSQPLKKVSPPSSRTATPRVPSSPLPSDPAPGSNMEVIGLRLNEVVNKACAGVDYKAKKAFRAGAGWSVGEAIIREFPAPPADAYLLRAILRTAVRSLSIYLNRLESLLLPAVTDPAFNAALGLTGGAPLNPTQTFAVSLAHTAWETCEKLEQTIELGTWPRFAEDALRPSMDKFDLIVGKVVKPLLLSLKNELEASLARTEGSPKLGPSISQMPTVPMSREHSNQPGSRLVKESSQAGHARQMPVPACLQHFAARVDGARRVLELVAAPCQHDGEGWTTKVVVAVVWTGMRQIALRDDVAVTARPPSPGSVAKALAGLSKDMQPPAVQGHLQTSSISGMTSKLANGLSILPSRTASRPPSPTRRSPSLDLASQALNVLESLVKRLVGGLVQPPHAASAGAASTQDQQAEHIAREALAEAIEALQSFRTVTQATHAPGASARLLASVRRLRDDVDDEAEEALDDAAEDLPAVVLFSTLLRRANAALAGLPVTNEKTPEPLRLRGPAEVWGWQRADFENKVLAGFLAAEEWGARVAAALGPEVERVLAELVAYAAAQGSKPGRDVAEATEWVKALGVALDARAGVKVANVA
ncbi:hypothetical protein Q5752_004793 [Cryptotrichosporon argae]